MLALGVAASLAVCAATVATATPRVSDPGRRIATHALSDHTTLVLFTDRAGVGALYRVGPSDAIEALSCDALPGAWGMWLADVDGDDAVEVVVALRKPARFDPVLENRLHVYALEGDRCVPLWRGSRLAGRFDAISVTGDQLLALERIGRGRRWIARYRWTGFGYAVDRVLWRGQGEPPLRLRRRLEP